MTIGRLLHLQPTESQYEILQRADHLFASRAGRYYAAQLTPEQVTILTRGVELKPIPANFIVHEDSSFL
jgi:hypothetical protein